MTREGWLTSRFVSWLPDMSRRINLAHASSPATWLYTTSQKKWYPFEMLVQQRFFQNRSLMGDQFTVTFPFTMRSSKPSKAQILQQWQAYPHFFLTSFRDVCSTYKFFQNRSIAAKSVYSIILICNVLFQMQKRKPRNLKSWNNDKHVYPHFQNAQWRMGIKSTWSKLRLGTESVSIVAKSEPSLSADISAAVRRTIFRGFETCNHDEVRCICNKSWGVWR